MESCAFVQIPDNNKTLAEILAGAHKYGTLNHSPEQYDAFHDLVMRMLDFKYVCILRGVLLSLP